MSSKLMKAWDDFVRAQIQELGTDVVERWIRPLKVKKFDACNLYLETSDSFKVLWFEEHIRPKIEANLYNNNNKKIKVHLQCKKEMTSSKPDTHVKHTSNGIEFGALAQDATFDHFVTGEENILAFKLLNEILETPLDQPCCFNPVYLYGDSGVGKTHLMMALANAMQKKGLQTAYVKALTFTEHVVEAIRKGDMQKFRKAYRHVDVLMIDDIEVLSKKGATQEELFHTFNTLHVQEKQIILSSRFAPSELSGIEQRLVSRFEWGIVIPLKKLSKQTIETIFSQKLESLNFSLEPQTFEFFIEAFGKNLKSLIQALDALVLRSHLAKHPLIGTISDSYVKKTLKDLVDHERKKLITPEKILQVVAENYGITVEDILGKSQSREFALPRQIAMHLCRDHLNMPFMQIGAFFTRDHSTVISSIKQVEKNLKNNKSDLAFKLQSMKKRLSYLT